MRRGDVILTVPSGDFGKPRPAVIVQTDWLNPTHESILACPFSTECIHAPLYRLTVQPTAENGLHEISQIMIDKAMPLKLKRIKKHLGILDAEQMYAVNRCLSMVFGLTI